MDGMHMETVPGKNKVHDVLIYTVSTCGWCKKTKRLLESLGVQYSYIDIDQLPENEKGKVTDEMIKHNPRCSTPTLVIDKGKDVIVGYQEDRIRNLLGGGAA
jgi:glutaredoxin-like protein NrdH